MKPRCNLAQPGPKPNYPSRSAQTRPAQQKPTAAVPFCFFPQPLTRGVHPSAPTGSSSSRHLHAQTLQGTTPAIPAFNRHLKTPISFLPRAYLSPRLPSLVCPHPRGLPAPRPRTRTPGEPPYPRASTTISGESRTP